VLPCQPANKRPLTSQRLSESTGDASAAYGYEGRTGGSVAAPEQIQRRREEEALAKVPDGRFSRNT
jgi:hypothetical protein